MSGPDRTCYDVHDGRARNRRSSRAGPGRTDVGRCRLRADVRDGQSSPWCAGLRRSTVPRASRCHAGRRCSGEPVRDLSRDRSFSLRRPRGMAHHCGAALGAGNGYPGCAGNHDSVDGAPGRAWHVVRSSSSTQTSSRLVPPSRCALRRGAFTRRGVHAAVPRQLPFIRVTRGREVYVPIGFGFHAARCLAGSRARASASRACPCAGDTGARASAWPGGQSVFHA